MPETILGCFLMLNIDRNCSESALKSKISAIRGVTGVYRVYGVYDMVVQSDINDLGYLQKTLIPTIRQMKDVRLTLTHIIHSYNP
jgi:DNA-binding Lrp family transcriptional regulator